MLVKTVTKGLIQRLNFFQAPIKSFLPQSTPVFEVVERLAVCIIGNQQHLLVRLAWSISPVRMDLFSRLYVVFQPFSKYRDVLLCSSVWPTDPNALGAEYGQSNLVLGSAMVVFAPR
jgi:hypothetical protein